MIECEDCPYYGKNNEGVGDCFYYTKTRPCDDHKDSDAYIGYWHPYPKEKPKEDAEYLVTISNPKKEFDGLFHRDIFVRIACYMKDKDIWFVGVGEVVAWAELPKPYEEE